VEVLEIFTSVAARKSLRETAIVKETCLTPQENAVETVRPIWMAMAFATTRTTALVLLMSAGFAMGLGLRWRVAVQTFLKERATA
jgi:hypothetical protein